MKHCFSCCYFKDGRMSKTWITPRCTYCGDDSAMFMRQHVCGLEEARLWKAVDSEANHSKATATDG